MPINSASIRPFIGSKKFAESSAFYSQLGFTEIILGPGFSLFQVNEKLAFYLQDAYVKDWIENTMVFLEVDDVELCNRELMEKNLPNIFPDVKISGIKKEPWGSEFFVHDPSGVLWHFGSFGK